MSNVVMAILVLVVTFIIASYGVYSNVEASRRTQLASSVGSTIARDAAHVQSVAQDLGRVPDAADVDDGRFARESGDAMQFSYVVAGGAGYVCGVVGRSDDITREAMNKVVRDHPGAFVSGQCGSSGASISDSVAVSLKVA